jgi:hypothetical protein
VTTVDLLGTQAAAGVKLVAFAQAAADAERGASGPARTGAHRPRGRRLVRRPAMRTPPSRSARPAASVTTATHVDAVLTYAIDLV